MSLLGIFPKYGVRGGWGVGGSIPKLFVKFPWQLFLALKTQLFWTKVTFLFLNVPTGGQGPPV